MLGDEMGEEFNIKCLDLNPYKFNECGLCSCYEDANNSLLGELLTGELTIEKLHKRTPANWKPKELEIFYFLNQYGGVDTYPRYYNDSGSIYLANHTRKFKTKEEAYKYRDFMNMLDSDKMSREEVLNENINKYYFRYNMYHDEIRVNYCCSSIRHNEFYFNKETIYDLLENHEEDIKYYLFGID